MKCNIGQKTILLAVFAFAVASIVPSAHAQVCSLAGAVGKYGFSDSGTIVGVGPRAAVGLLTFNALGKIQGTVTASLNGSVTRTTLLGTYTVNPDCSGTASFGESDQSGEILTATVAIVWDANMQEARFLFTSVVLAANNAPLLTVINGGARKLVVIGQ